MSAIATLPPFKALTAFRTFTVDEYHEMIDAGILTDEDKVELLEGYLVLKMPKNPPHESTVRRLNARLLRLIPSGWVLSCQGPVTFTESEPEPDFTLFRGSEGDYDQRHPGPTDVGLLIEVAESSLERDRTDKARIYARAAIPVYWIVNLIDRRIEVLTDPTGPDPDPHYRTTRVFGPGMAVPVELDGVTIATIPVDDIIA
jgi:Uma2 family endonuclease